MKEFGNINDLMTELDDFDLLEGEGGLTIDDTEKRNNIRLELAHKLNLEAISWKQKVREKWLKDGDKNTRYFQCLTNQRRRSNYVEDIVIGSDCTFGNDNIREAAKGFF